MSLDVTAIIVAVFSFLGTALGSFSGFRLTSYRVGELEKKVDMHNNFARRLPVVEEQVRNLERRMAERRREE